MRRRFLFILVVVVLIFLAVYKLKKREAPVSTDNLPALPIKHDAQAKPIIFLHKTFTLKKSVTFSVEVPPHSVIPRIQGTFQSFVPRPGDDDLSDESTDVTFLLMNAEQYADFSRNPAGGEALVSVEATHNHEVEFALPPTNDSPVKYYLAFVSAPGGIPVKTVTADFGLYFGYQ